MGLAARSKAHDGVPPAAAMVTPFSMPCGTNLLNEAYHMNPEARSKCAPPNFDQYWWSNVGYYSPALCPSGFVPGCFRWNSDQGPKVEVTETAVMCVPQGYACHTKDVSLAFSYSASAAMIQIRWAETDLPNFATHPLYPGANPTNTEVLGEGALITQRAALVDRQASGGFASGSFDDPSLFPSSIYDSSLDGFFGTSGGDDGSTGFPKFTDLPGDDDGPRRSSGLTTGAKVGIGVGCGVVALIAMGVGVFVLLWYRGRAKRAAAAYPGPGPQYPGQGPGQWNAAGAAPGIPEMQDDGKSELPGGFSTASPTVAGSETQGPTPIPAAYSPVDKERKYTPSPAPVSELSPELATTPTPQQGNPGAIEYQEVHGQSRSPFSELPSESQFTEVHGTPASPYSELPATESRPSVVSPSSPVQRKALAQSPPPPATQTHSGPDHGVSILPGAGHTPASATFSPTGAGDSALPSAQELDALREQHAQLERRRERLIELERIEQEQADLQDRMRQR